MDFHFPIGNMLIHASTPLGEQQDQNITTFFDFLGAFYGDLFSSCSNDFECFSTNNCLFGRCFLGAFEILILLLPIFITVFIIMLLVSCCKQICCTPKGQRKNPIVTCCQGLSFGQYHTKLYYKNQSMVASCFGGCCTFTCYMIIFFYAMMVLLGSSSPILRIYQLKSQWNPPTTDLNSTQFEDIMSISSVVFVSNRTVFTTQAECDAEFQGLSFNLRYHAN